MICICGDDALRGLSQLAVGVSIIGNAAASSA